VKRRLLPFSRFRELPEVIRVSLKVSRECPNRLRHLCDVRCELFQLRGELGRFDGWRFNARGRREIAHNSEGIVKLVDLPGELAKAKQIESGHVFQESHAVDRFPFDSPGLLNDPLDLIFGTDYLYGHSDNLDREFQRMSSCGQRAALDVMSGYLDDWARQGEHLRVGVGDADNAGVAELLAAELAESKSVVELVRYNIGPSVAVHRTGGLWARSGRRSDHSGTRLQATSSASS